MSKSLPHYDTLMRWTVQDVINWLQKIQLGTFVKAFRDSGVDGQKLCKLTNTDLLKMRDCPLKNTEDLLNYISKVEGRKAATTSNCLKDIKPPPRLPSNDNRSQQVIEALSDSESDNWEYSPDEFEKFDEVDTRIKPAIPKIRERRDLPALPVCVPALPVRGPALPQHAPVDTDSDDDEDYLKPDPKPQPRLKKKSLPPVPGRKNDTPSVDHRLVRPLPPPNHRMPKSPLLPLREPEEPAPNNHVKQQPITSQENLSNCPWYHGSMTREVADSLLKKHSEEGMFLLRDSNKSVDQPYTLVIYSGNKVSNLPIRVNAENDYTAGTSTFHSLKEMIEFFQKYKLVLAGKQSGVYLSRPLP